MTSNMALRRFKKANRRKAVVADRRRAEASEATLPGAIRRAAAGPIHYCRMHETLFETGMGTLIVVRGASSRNVHSTVSPGAPRTTISVPMPVSNSVSCMRQ